MYLHLFMQIKKVPFEDIKKASYFKEGLVNNNLSLIFFNIEESKLVKDTQGNKDWDILEFYQRQTNASGIIINPNDEDEHYLISRKSFNKNPFYKNCFNPINFPEIKDFIDQDFNVLYKFDKDNILTTFIIRDCSYNCHKTNGFRHYIELTSSIHLAEIQNGILILKNVNGDEQNYTFSKNDLTKSPFYRYIE